MLIKILIIKVEEGNERVEHKVHELTPKVIHIYIHDEALVWEAFPVPVSQ